MVLVGTAGRVEQEPIAVSPTDTKVHRLQPLFIVSLFFDESELSSRFRLLLTPSGHIIHGPAGPSMVRT